MPGNTFLRRLGIERPSVIELASEAADAGFWLAVRIAPDVSEESLAGFLDNWVAADLSPIADVLLPASWHRPAVVADTRVQWLVDVEQLSGVADSSSAAPVIPAAAKGAERSCRELRLPLVVLDEVIPPTFGDPTFTARAEREKSFVRCAKTLLSGIAERRIGRASLWTRTPRVLAACRVAARTANLDFDDRYEFCLPHSELQTAERLLREGETVRLWFSLDRTDIDRAMAR